MNCALIRVALGTITRGETEAATTRLRLEMGFFGCAVASVSPFAISQFVSLQHAGCEAIAGTDAAV